MLIRDYGKQTIAYYGCNKQFLKWLTWLSCIKLYKKLGVLRVKRHLQSNNTICCWAICPSLCATEGMVNKTLQSQLSQNGPL